MEDYDRIRGIVREEMNELEEELQPDYEEDCDNREEDDLSRRSLLAALAGAAALGASLLGGGVILGGMIGDEENDQTPDRTPSDPGPGRPDPVNEYSMDRILDTRDQEAINLFLRDVGTIESLELEQEVTSGGAGHYSITALTPSGETYEFELVPEGVYQDISYSIEAEELSQLNEAYREGKLNQVFDESPFFDPS